MKNIDFSFVGGFPMSQDTLDFMQSAYTDGVKAIIEAAVDPAITAFIVSGCIESPAFTWSAGWIYHSGNLVPFAGGVEPVTADLVEIKDVNSSATFDDTNVHEVYFDKTATLGDTGEPVTVLLRELKRLPEMLGKKAETDAWTDITITTSGNGAVTGTLSYRKNYLSGTLHIKGSFLATDAQAIANPLVLSFIGPLPVGYRPLSHTPVTACVGSSGFPTGYVPEVNGTEHIAHIMCELNTDGKFYYRLPKPAAGITTYYFYFNALVPLL